MFEGRATKRLSEKRGLKNIFFSNSYQEKNYTKLLLKYWQAEE